MFRSRGMSPHRARLNMPYPKVHPELYPNVLPEDVQVASSSSPQKKTSAGIWFYRRNFMAILAFFGFLFAYMLRTNLSVAVVAMTKSQNVTIGNETKTQQDFNWNSKEKGNILGAFFYGYVFTQVIGGWLSIKIGGAKVFGIGILITAVIDLVIPFCAHYGILVLVMMRASQGFFQGATYPSMHAVWARWAPPQERTRLASVGFSGGFMGTMVTFPMCGYLADRFGWSYTFYVPGLATCIWCAIWLFGVRDEPTGDPWISQEELDYLRETLGNSQHKDIKHPWLSFLLSMPVWAIVMSHFCQNWGFYTMITMLPTYLAETLKFSISLSGALSSLPFLVMSVGLPIAGIIVDAVGKSGRLSTTAIRKIFNCGAFLIQFGFMILAALVSDSLLSIIFITFSIGMGAFAWAAFGVNHLDIAAPHAGVLMGISNMVAAFGGILSPPLTGYLVVNKTREEWNTVFFIASGFYLLGALFYAIFGSGEHQPWVEEEPLEEEYDSYYENIQI